MDLHGANTDVTEPGQGLPPALGPSRCDIHSPILHTSGFCTSEGISMVLSSISWKSLRTHWVLGVMSLFYFIPNEGGGGSGGLQVTATRFLRLVCSGTEPKGAAVGP